jgi:hypothetical protein
MSRVDPETGTLFPKLLCNFFLLIALLFAGNDNEHQKAAGIN